MPAPTPSGTPMTLAKPRMKTDPTIAFAIPPPASPTGFGVWVRKAQLIDPTPRKTRYANIANNGTSTRMTVSTATPVITWLVIRRRKEIGGTVCAEIFLSGIGPRRLAASDRPDQQSGQSVDRDGYQEKGQTNLD